MKMFEVGDRSPFLIDLLVEVWEDSVKNTHLFLSKEEVENMSGEDLRDEKLIKEKFPIFLICSIV